MIAQRRREGGVRLRSRDGIHPFEVGPLLIPNMRHAAVTREGRRLIMFYSHIGDTPESILRSEVRLDGYWVAWKASEAVIELHGYEGTHQPIRASAGEKAQRSVHELRDPAVLIAGMERYLYYAVAGEQEIGSARFVNSVDAL